MVVRLVCLNISERLAMQNISKSFIILIKEIEKMCEDRR